MKRMYGLIGQTLKHSYSKEIHESFFAEEYRLLETEPQGLADLLNDPELCGANVTIPYKRRILPLLNKVEEEAAKIGSVNTVVRGENGEWIGYNTDLYGFRETLKRKGFAFQGAKIVILGSGGASKTVQYAAKTAGAKEIVVVSRNGAVSYRDLPKHFDADYLVNTTPVGMFPHTEDRPVSLRGFERLSGVMDLIYNPHRTLLLQEAEERKIPCIGGLYMLVAQAKAAEELFFRRSIPNEKAEQVYAELNRRMQNIVLIGMPGCGKSSAGKALAELTGRELVDLDAVVEREQGRTIPEIFCTDGEEGFRALERAAILQYGKCSGKILVTGGGAVKDVRNRAALRCNGRVYHIERATELLPKEGRPLSLKTDLCEMYRERYPLYQSFCDCSVENDTTVGELAWKIWRDYEEHLGD